MLIIKSKKFLLRPYKRTDEKSLIRNINHKDINKYTTRIPFPYKKKDAKNWINHCINLEKKKKKNEINFAIDVYGEVIGGIGFMNIEMHKAEIGYWLAKKYWNRGIMTSAVNLVSTFGIKKLKLKRIYACLFPNNKASVRVLEKNNYKLEGILKKYHFKNGKFIDGLLYAKVK